MIRIALTLLVLCLVSPVLGQEWDERTEEDFKLTASDGTNGDHFGFAVGISGDYLVVGAFRDADEDTNSGSAYIFRYDPAEEEWVEEQKFTASDAAEDDVFGHELSISGERLVVGAAGDDDNGSGSGSAYVFRRRHEKPQRRLDDRTQEWTSLRL